MINRETPEENLLPLEGRLAPLPRPEIVGNLPEEAKPVDSGLAPLPGDANLRRGYVYSGR